MLACIAWTAPRAWRHGAFIDRLKQESAVKAVPNGGLDPHDWQAPRIRQPFARIEKRDSSRHMEGPPAHLSYTRGVDAHGDGCQRRRLKRSTDRLLT
jgi:hypothetical protein